MKEKVLHFLQKLTPHLPSAVLEKVFEFTEVLLSQHIKERQARKFQTLQSQASNTRAEELTWRQKDENMSQQDIFNKRVKNLLVRELTQKEKNVYRTLLCHYTTTVACGGPIKTT